MARNAALRAWALVAATERATESSCRSDASTSGEMSAGSSRRTDRAERTRQAALRAAARRERDTETDKLWTFEARAMPAVLAPLNPMHRSYLVCYNARYGLRCFSKASTSSAKDCAIELISPKIFHMSFPRRLFAFLALVFMSHLRRG